MTYRATQLYVRASTAIHSAVRREDGAGMVEYALLVALVAIVLVVAVGFLGGKLNDKFNEFGTVVGDA